MKIDLKQGDVFISTENQIGYVRMFLDAKEFENYLETHVDEKYKGKPIVLTDVEFNKCDRSIDFSFIVFVGDDECTGASRNGWSTDRMKIDLKEMTSFKDE